MASQQAVIRPTQEEVEDTIIANNITDYRNAAVARSNEAIESAQDRYSSVQATRPEAPVAVQATRTETPVAATAKVDTKTAASAGTQTVTNKLQGMSVTAKEVANSAAKTLTETLHYGREKAVENIRIAQENTALLAQRAKDNAVAASASAYHASKDTTVQGLITVGHHAAGVTSGVVEGIQDHMGVERINKSATGSDKIDAAADNTAPGAATKDYTKSTTKSALKVVGDYVSHGVDLTKHAVGGVSQGVYEGLGGAPYKDGTILEEGQKITPDIAEEVPRQAQHHMQHPVGKKAHETTTSIMQTATGYVAHGVNVTKEAVGGTIQGLTEHVKKGTDSKPSPAIGSSIGNSQERGVVGLDSDVRAYDAQKQETIAAVENAAQKMATNADYAHGRVAAALTDRVTPEMAPAQVLPPQPVQVLPSPSVYV